MPSQITSNKLYLIAGFPEDRRLMTLNLLVLAAVGLTLRSSSGLAIMLKFTKTLRNSVFTYMGGGLLIVPEIYNPWIREQVFG